MVLKEALHCTERCLGLNILRPLMFVFLADRAKKMLGPMYRLTKEPRTVFVRAMMLFSLISTNGDEESGNGGQGQL